MAIIPLTDVESRANYFHRRVLLNLQYWGDYVAANTTDIAALDGERPRIVRAISFGLELNEAWSIAYKLITAFSPYMERRGFWEPWNSVLSWAIKAAHRSEDVAAEVNLSSLLARLLQRQGRDRQAIAYYRRAITLSRRIGDYFNEARACTNLGYLYIEQGYWRRAEVLCCHALTIFEQISSDHGRAHTENHLGILYTEQNLWDKARQHLECACALWQSMGDDHGLMRGFINLGMLYLEQDQPDKALVYLEKALDQARLTGEEAEIGTIYRNIGLVHRRKGEPAKAEMYARQAEAIFQRFSNLPKLALVRDNLGLACLAQGKWQEAWQQLESALETWRDLKHEYGEIRTLLYMVEYELARGDYSKAAARLDELEQLDRQNNWIQRYPGLQPLLIKQRRSLPGRSTQQAAAS
jgi:tetratricopeptide (TPR) repeat protein